MFERKENDRDERWESSNERSPVMVGNDWVNRPGRGWIHNISTVCYSKDLKMTKQKTMQF